MAALTAALLGLTAYGAYQSATNKGPAPTVLPPTLTPAVNTTGAVAAGIAQRRRAAGSYSARSTLLTGPAGVTAPPPVTRKTLLGS